MLFHHTRSIVTDAAGAAEVYVGEKIIGRVVAIRYSPGSLDAGADLTLTGDVSGSPVLTVGNAGAAEVWFYPQVTPHKAADGSEIAGGQADVFLFGERVKVVVAQGGNVGAGSITIFTEEDY